MELGFPRGKLRLRKILRCIDYVHLFLSGRRYHPAGQIGIVSASSGTPHQNWTALQTTALHQLGSQFLRNVACRAIGKGMTQEPALFCG